MLMIRHLRLGQQRGDSRNDSTSNHIRGRFLDFCLYGVVGYLVFSGHGHGAQKGVNVAYQPLENGRGGVVGSNPAGPINFRVIY
jgi:hypothetical protein